MASSIRFVRRKDKPNKKGLYAIRLCITKNKQRKYFALNIFVNPEYWDETNEILIIHKNLKGELQKKENEQRKLDNALLDKYKVRARDIVYNFNMKGIDWTLNQFEDAFKPKSRQDKIKPYFENHIKTLRETNRQSTAQCYEAALQMQEHYDKRLEQRYFTDIDVRYVRSYDTFLQKRGCKGNSRLFYMKTMRAVMNKAIQEGLAPESSYPFGKGKFQVGSLGEATAKRYVPKEHFDKIKNTEMTDPRLEYARQLFMFSYYCYGISFVDMALLTTGNIKHLDDGEYIVYKRQKVKHQKNAKQIPIKITEQIRLLIEKLQATSPTVDNYLLPIIAKSGLKGQKLYNHRISRYTIYNNNLSKLAQELNINNFHLTSYASRHTAAMMLQGNKVTREVISQMLGHTDFQTTKTYLDDFDVSVINEAAKVL